MRVSVLIATAATAIGLMAVPALAQTPADLTQFTASCQGGEAFLLGQVPEGVDTASILTPLCGCLTTSFKELPQNDVDMLAADLRGEGTDEAHAAHGDYAGLTERAREGLTTCFASPEVTAAMAAAQPPAEPAPAEPAPADPAAPATPQ